MGRSWPPKKPTENLPDRIKKSLELYPCDWLFIHRDAESETVEKRLLEIETCRPQTPQTIPIVPVRRLEAWLLFDESLIRMAAGNPSGKADLALPQLQKLETLPDPKAMLFSLLRTASGLNGRRLAKFNVYEARARVAVLADDFSPLKQLSAFQSLAKAIQDELSA